MFSFWQTISIMIFTVPRVINPFLPVPWGVWEMMTSRRRRTRRSTMRKGSWILVPRHWTCGTYKITQTMQVLDLEMATIEIHRHCWWCFLIQDFCVRGVQGYINFPLWLESWRAGFICPNVSQEACPSQQQQWETRCGRNSAGDWCLAPFGWDMWWHTHRYTHRFVQWFSYSTDFDL